MSEIPTPALPTILTLQHFARNGEVALVVSLIDAAENGAAAPELVRQLGSLELRLELQQGFKQARSLFQALKSNRPDILRGRNYTDERMRALLPQAAWTHRENTSGYLQWLDASFASPRSADPDSEEPVELRRIRQGLLEEETRERMLGRVMNLHEADNEWMVGQTHGTIAAVKENLWETVQEGFDVSAAVEAGVSHRRLASYTRDWRETTEENFQRTAREMGDALEWLESEG